MKMVRIVITVHTERDAIWTDEQNSEVVGLLADWARGYVKNIIEPVSEDSIDNFVNDIELPPGPVATALSKENTTLKVKVEVLK